MSDEDIIEILRRTKENCYEFKECDGCRFSMKNTNLNSICQLQLLARHMDDIPSKWNIELLSLIIKDK